MRKIDEASRIAYKGIEVCDEKLIKAEIAFNIANDYFNKKDLTNFNIWAKETRKLADHFSKYLGHMESKIKK